MAARRRNAPGPVPPSLGFSYQAPGPVGAAADVSPVDHEIAEALRDYRRTQMINRVAPGLFGAPAQGGGYPMTGSGPQPTSLPEAVNAAVGISKLHEGAAQTAMQMAETERQRRMEAEQSRGAAAAAAADEEASKWDALTQMQNSFREEMGAMRSELHQAQIAQKDSEAARLVAEMKAHAEKVEAAIKAEKERVESELARTRAENAALRQRPTLQELQVRAIQNPDDPELAPFRQVYGNRGESIDEWARKEQLSRHFRSQDAEERRKEERHRSGLRLRRNLDGLFGEARGALGRFTPGQPRGLDLNGVSADFPDDPPADPEGDVAADA